MIEFRCPQCQSLLRTPDETAGKKARCPSCSAVVPIPAASTSIGRAPPEVPPVPPGMSGGPPTGQEPDGYVMPPPGSIPPPPGAASWGPGGAVPPLAPDSQNPFQSPLGWEGPPGTAPGALWRGFSPRPVGVGEILSRSWAIFRDRMSICLMAILAMGGVNIVMSMLGQGAMALASTLPEAGQVLMIFLVQVVTNLVSIWVGLGGILLMLEVTRGGNPNLGLLFQGGPYLVRSIVATLVLMLAWVGIFLVVGLPAGLVAYALGFDTPAGIAVIVLGGLLVAVPFVLIWFCAMFFQYCLVDQNVGAIDSLRYSWRISQGNRLNIFLLILSLAGINLLGLLACCVGMFFTMAFALVCLAVGYLLMSGQGVTEPKAY